MCRVFVQYFPTLLAIVSMFSAGCDLHPAHSSEAKEEERAAAPLRVDTFRVEVRPKPIVVKADGFLAAWEQATLSTKVSGRLQELPVDLGSVVKRGDLLAQIDPRDYELRVRQAEAMLAQARVRLGLPLSGSDDTVDLEATSAARQTQALLIEAEANRDRLRRLHRDGIAPQAELDAAEAAYSVALTRHQTTIEELRMRHAQVAQRRAELELARHALQETGVIAPFDGVIQTRLANIGEYLQPSAPVVRLARTDPLRLRLDVSEVDAGLVRLGQRVLVQLPGGANRYQGELKRLSPVIDEQTRMLRVEADVPNSGMLRPGAFATAEIVVGTDPNGIFIPASALVVFAGMERVYVVEKGRAIERNVVSGDARGELPSVAARDGSGAGFADQVAGSEPLDSGGTSSGNSGPTAGGWVEIVSGLRPGEVLILSPGNLRSGHPVEVAN